ncbi:MAG TPA: TonB-dependent receptor plug domain-containing protein [Rhizomicrobium sp.]|nr:TonB-dependent receptor plug domain-containing protein [Rhizomicrobium sp.]
MNAHLPRNAAHFVAGLFISTALCAPAFAAEIETVVVTAQKKVENIQTVPIAVTAFTAEDLKEHQIVQFKDLVFSTPNVSYTKTNFTGADFQIRGIGIAAIAGDAESGVAVHEDDVYLANPPLAEASFYGLDRIEVLRGPQSTLYGRGATGGTVNVITAKPDLDQFGGNGEATYGNYNQTELKGAVNIPIVTDMLGVRVAGDWVKHDGFVLNINNGQHYDNENTYSVRGSVRFQPTQDTTIDLVASSSRESDNKMRSQKQLCTTDPTGTLGCLPDSLGTQPVNPNATLSNISSSVQAMESLGASINPLLAGEFANFGFLDLRQTPVLPAGDVDPASLRQINTDFAPLYRASENFVALNAKQNINPDLTVTFVGGYEDHSTWSQESYNNVPALPIDQTALASAEGNLAYVLSGGIPVLGPGFNPAYYANFAPYFTAHPGELPVSGTKNLGLTGGDIAFYTPNATAYDQSDAYSKQYSAELRLNTSFQGPVNFLLAGYYLKTQGYTDYFVNASTLDYPAIVLGSIFGGLGVGQGGIPLPTGLCDNGCISASSYYHNVGDNIDLESKSVFGEAYYDAIPDTLKFTAGLRFTDDVKSEMDRIELFSGLVPIGTTNEEAAMAALAAQHQKDFDPSNGLPDNPDGTPIGSETCFGPCDAFAVEKETFDKYTGRAVVDWTPKLDFTNQTLVYASYARGYKAGGFNPGVEEGIGVPNSYGPEGIDAFEAGTKNLLADGTLQANLAAWYYNYEGLQVSSIIDNTSVNQNIDAHLWGVEGEFFYAPDDNWQFNLNFGTVDSQIGKNVNLVDPRNPTAGRSDVVLVKDDTLAPSDGENCVLYMLPGTTVAPADNPVLDFIVGGHANNPYLDPPGGSQALAGHGVALTNYGTCLPANQGGIPDAALNAAGYSRTDPRVGSGDQSGGATVNLGGNHLQNTPPITISVGAQYTFKLDGGYSLIPRADFYWQDRSWASVFNDAPDALKAYEVTNAQITLSAPEDKWYVQGFIKNAFNSTYITGEYLTSATSGLYTNAFLGDPRTYGIRIGAKF